MKKLTNFKKGLIYALAALLIVPTWLAAGVGSVERVKAGTDTEAPYLTNIGFDADGLDVQYGPGDYYYLATDGNSATDHLLDFDVLTAGSEPLAAGYYGLYLTGSQVNSTDLKQYYDDRGTPEPYLSYLKEGVDGTKPFAYIKCDGSADVELVDAVKHDLVPVDTDMTIPGDYPSGWYSVSTRVGEGFEDLAGNEGSASFNLIIDSTKPNVSVLTPVSGEQVNGATDYEITWSATDDESGIKTNSIKIKYYNGSSWTTLATNLPKTGSYSWSVPKTATTTGKIKVIAYNNVDMKGKDTAKNLDIADRTVPVITLLGDAEMNIEIGEAFTDPGATAIDNYDGDVSGDIIVGGDVVDESTPGDYVITYNVFDTAGNSAIEVLRIVHVLDLLPAPANLAVSNEDKTIKASWDAVVGANFYYVSIGHVGGGYVSTDEVVGTSFESLVGDYGDYKVRVIASRKQITDFAKLNSMYPIEENISVVATVPVVTVASVPAVAKGVSVAPKQVQAEEDSGAIEKVLDEEGKIKGEEDEDAAEDEDINWTPWIILFILIILAGAATGGYFYWFTDEEEVETKVKDPQKPVKKSGGKKTAKKKSSNKRRW